MRSAFSIMPNSKIGIDDYFTASTRSGNRDNTSSCLPSVFSSFVSSPPQLPLHALSFALPRKRKKEKISISGRLNVKKRNFLMSENLEYLDKTSSISSLFSSFSNHSNARIFYMEIATVISSYLTDVYLQKAMNNSNTNSSGYAEGMVSKMLNIIEKIPKNELTRDKYISVGRDALYLYHNVISNVTGPKHQKRLRTPQQQADFCYVLAMLVNDAPIASDLFMNGKSTNLVQFASTIGDPAYRLAVHKLTSMFNSSYAVYKALNLDLSLLQTANQILSILTVRNSTLCERKPRTLAQSVFLFLNPDLRDNLRASGLTNEESSVVIGAKLVSQQLASEGITARSLKDGYRLMCGNYVSNGYTLKHFGVGEKDTKIIGLTTLLCERIRKHTRILPFY